MRAYGQSLVAVTAFFSVPGDHIEDVQPVLMVHEKSMPREVPKGYYDDASSENDFLEDSTQNIYRAVEIYRTLRTDFEISHSEMGKWLGVQRRSLYNWMNDPEKSKVLGPKIEARLDSFKSLRDEMEPEHRPLLFKIAFSPIYGDPRFGLSILDGATSKELVSWYDKLFSQFESYRSIRS